MNIERCKIVTCFLAIVGIEILYGVTGYQSEQQVIRQNQSEMVKARERKQSLELQKEKLTDMEEVLQVVTNKKEAMMNKIPDYKAHSQQMAQWMRYIACYDFSNISFELIGSEDDEQPIESIISERYELSFIGKYEEIVEFIENLSASSPMLRICRIDFSNEVQDMEREENKALLERYEEVSEIVQATIELCLYIKDGTHSGQEIYDSDFTINRHNDSLFKWDATNSKQVMAFMQEEEDTTLEGESEEIESKQAIKE